MSADEIELLRPVNVSLGMMLESTSKRLLKRGEAHFGCPDKAPAVRLATLRSAGVARAAFTSGILIGIGETPKERADSLFALLAIHREYGHLQEVIIQNFRTKPDIPFADRPEPASLELARTVAVARLIFGDEVNIQVPPNLNPDSHRLLLAAGVLAYALQPLAEAMARRGWPRSLAATLAVLLAVVSVLAMALLVVPIIARELPILREQIPRGAEWANQVLAPALARLGLEVRLDVAGIKDMVLKGLGGNLEDGLSALLSSARLGGSVVLTVLGNLVLVPLVLFYLLLDWPLMMERLRQLVPPRMRASVDSFLGECDELLGQYLRGQLLVMLSAA